MAQTITVVVRSPEEMLFQGNAVALSTFNSKGPLDVLPLHENFISIIEKQVVVHTDSGEKSFPVQYGILRVTSNEISVLLGVQAVEAPIE